MRKEGKLPGSQGDFMRTLASHADSDGRNLLHDAALAVAENETRYFTTLVKLGFPLYGEDAILDTPAFLLCQTKDENAFVTCFNALCDQRFDIHRENDDDETFLQRLCLSSRVSESRVQAVISREPTISHQNLSKLVAMAAISKQRANQTTKMAI